MIKLKLPTNVFPMWNPALSANRPNLRSLLWIGFVAFPYVVLIFNPQGSRLSSLILQEPHLTDDGIVRQAHQADRKAHNWTLVEVLRAVSMPDKTVIITAINQAWADGNGSMLDLFLESLHRGSGTENLMNHLLIIALDRKAYERCVQIHPYCYQVETEGVDLSTEKSFLTPGYKKLMARRLEIMKNVLDYGYSILFTDTDVIWLRNPFPHFLPYIDIHFSTDQFNGDDTDLWRNTLNTGFFHMKANKWTTNLYEQWLTIVQRDPELTDQLALNWFKKQQEFLEIGVRIKVLDTEIFAGFCRKEPTRYAKLTTMHATCCIGLKPKLEDLRANLDGFWTHHRLNQTHVNGSSWLPTIASACHGS